MALFLASVSLLLAARVGDDEAAARYATAGKPQFAAFSAFGAVLFLSLMEALWAAGPSGGRHASLTAFISATGCVSFGLEVAGWAPVLTGFSWGAPVRACG